MNKFRAAFATGVIFVLIGIGILGAVLFLKNLPAIMGEFADTPVEAVAIFIAGAITLKISQILRLYRARRIREKKAEKSRRLRAIAASKAKAKANSEAEAKSEAEPKEQQQ